MNLIKDELKNEMTIHKSRFITTIIRVNSVDEANDGLTRIKKIYYDATHNCYAYIIGENQEIQKCSDDGEPQKTAGYPILDVLKKKELTNVLVVVTRYYGGIMLGAGGLKRAYSNSANEALKKSIFYQVKLYNVYSLEIKYSMYHALSNFLVDKLILESNFAENVLLTIALEKEKSPSLLKSLNDLTNGQASIIYLRIKQIEIPCGNT